jgi:deazaflavin-dependent oxidoreductase (nitroreductase family)
MPLEGEYAPTTHDQVRAQVEEYEASGGTRGTTVEGRPVVLLTTMGVKSGKLRKSPVMRVEHEGVYAAVASRGGEPRHPDWYFNLKAHPHLELQDGPVKHDMVARESEGDERELWWERAVTAYPTYAEYQRMTTRQIPVFILERDAAG